MLFIYNTINGALYDDENVKNESIGESFHGCKRHG